MTKHKEPHPKHERTLVIIKPDGIQRTLIGEIISRYERVGLKLIGIKMVIPTKAQAEKHYTLDPNWLISVGQKNLDAYKEKGLKPPFDNAFDQGNAILQKLIKYLSSGPVIPMVWQGAHAVKIVRKITGGTEPLTTDVGTIRGDYVLDSYEISDNYVRALRNLVHASGSVQEAENEIQHWFSEDEIAKYTHFQEKILYDVNLDGILE
jgi:nucleoside-diphosphate kinase